MDPLFTSAIDQAAAELRDDIDQYYPMLAALVREKQSPWHDGAGFVEVDLLRFRSDPDALILRLFAWDALLHERTA